MLVELIRRQDSDLLDIRKGTRDQRQAQIAKASLMEILLAILDLVFGCHHLHLSRVFTLQGETYRVCCDCGSKFAYSLETMAVERQLPLAPALTRFRIV